MDSSDGSDCPENSNSTDCLLRALLQFLREQRDADDAKTNWDPINFTFTLLIGLVAILFALATILQAIFTAGKGRRKTNHLAVGEWSKKTIKKWDWSEMDFRFTALVPILRGESLSMLRYKRHEYAVRGSWLRVVGNPQFIPPEAEPAPPSWRVMVKNTTWFFFPSRHRPEQSQNPSAAWLQFFREVGLDKLDISDWGNNVREVSTEYLPDDLVAAPAYVQLGAIVALAATRGIQKVDIDQQNYPILFGRGFQVDFRQHPTLGVVGAYSRYDDKTNTLPRTPDLAGLVHAEQHGQGVLEVSIPQPPYGSIYQDENLKVDCSTKLTRRRLLERWVHGLRSYASHRDDSAFALQESAVSEAHLPLIIGFFATTPYSIPALFPTTILQTQIPLSTLALNGKYWAEARLDKVQRLDINGFPVVSTFDKEMIPSWYAFDWHHYDEGNLRNDPKAWDNNVEDCRKRYWGKDIQALKDEDEQFHSNNAYGHCVILHMCLKLLLEPDNLAEWFFELSLDVREELRHLTFMQIKEIDQWLEATRESMHDYWIRSFILCATTIVLLQAELAKDQWPSEAEETSASSDILQPVNLDQRQSSGAIRLGHTTARTIHSTVLKHLQHWVAHKKSVSGSREWHTDLIDGDHLGRLRDRLRPLVVTQSAIEEEEVREGRDREEEEREEGNGEEENEERVSQEQGRKERRRLKRYNNAFKDIDDVIIYRVLMILLLFRTSPDSSKVLESGLWDKIVPMI